MTGTIKVKDQEVYLPETKRIKDASQPFNVNAPNTLKVYEGFDNFFSDSIATRTFSTNKKEYLEIAPLNNNTNSNNASPETVDLWQILDGFYSMATLEGYVFGFGDGCGGHLDAQEDRKIADAVKIVAQTAIEALLKYDSADAIQKNINDIFNQDFTDNVRTKLANHNNTCNTTVIAGRTFKSKKDGFYRLVGFSVGDSNLIAYNPLSKKFTNISPGIKSMTGGTANYPTSYKGEDVYIFDIELEEGTLIMPLSDGLADFFEQNIEVQTDLSRKYGWIKESKMKNILSSLPENVSVRGCLKKIIEEAVNRFEETKQKRLKNLPSAQNKYEQTVKKLEELESKKSTFEEKKYLKKKIELQEKLQQLDAERGFTLGDDCLIAGLKLPTEKDMPRFISSLFKAAIIEKNEESLKAFTDNFSFDELEKMLIKLDALIGDKTLLKDAQRIIYQAYAEKPNSGILKHEIQISKNNNDNNVTATEEQQTATTIEKSFFNEKNGEKTLRKVKIFSEDQNNCKYTFFLKPNQLQKLNEKEEQYQNELIAMQKK